MLALRKTNYPPKSSILSFFQDQMRSIMFFDYVQNGEYVPDRHFEKYC